ncbi:MAG: damage-inducible protein DinB [Treponema sp.]|nr:damage-inducible protein DinB [Treponema sp.]
MKKIFVNFAKYNQEADEKIISILGKMENAERVKNRKSYYKSLAGLVSHIAGGTSYMLSLAAQAVSGNAEAQKALAPLKKIELPQGGIDEEGWKKILSAVKTADKAYTAFAEALRDEDFSALVKLDWYGGKPAAVPLYFMLQSIETHGTHHRGQISQILDELKIDNDYSGINAKFLKA